MPSIVTKRLQIVFALLFVGALALVLYRWYDDYIFKKNPLSQKIISSLEQKRAEVLRLSLKRYSIDITDIPMLISDEINSNLYGFAQYIPHGENRGKIRVVLNKKRLKESLDYVVEEVIAHEYAHAFMFRIGRFSRDDGHSKEWQDICFALGGKKCERYVDSYDIVMGKIGI